MSRTKKKTKRKTDPRAATTKKTETAWAPTARPQRPAFTADSTMSVGETEPRLPASTASFTRGRSYDAN